MTTTTTKNTIEQAFAMLAPRLVRSILQYKGAKTMNKYRYEVKQIDAWLGPDNEWYWNDAYNLGILTTVAGTKQGLKKALTMFLVNHVGILLNSRETRCDYDGDILEIHDRSTDEPLFAMIPLF